MINALPAHGGSHGCQRLSCLRYVTCPLRWFVHRALTCTCALGVIADIERRLPSPSSTTSPSSCLILTLEKMRGEGKADREDQSLSCSQRPMCEGSWPTMWTRQSECHPPRQRPLPGHCTELSADHLCVQGSPWEHERGADKPSNVSTQCWARHPHREDSLTREVRSHSFIRGRITSTDTCTLCSLQHYPRGPRHGSNHSALRQRPG